MTNNIQKLYELAGVKKVPFSTLYAVLTTIKDYPPFTDTKQLNLIKWFSEKIYCIELSHNGREFEFYTYSSEIRTRDKDFSKALASFIYYKWEDLTPEQKEEIKRMLE